jgi:tyrosinase
MPPAFAATHLPPPHLHIPHQHLGPNPLFVTARYGPDGTGAIYVPTAAGIAAHPHDPNFVPGTVMDA